MQFALTGNEVQIQALSYVIHADMDLDEEMPKLEERLRACFEGETAHLISRITTQTTSATMYAESGHLDVLIQDAKDWVKEVYSRAFSPVGERVGFPLDFRFMNFVNYTPLQKVERASQ